MTPLVVVMSKIEGDPLTYIGCEGYVESMLLINFPPLVENSLVSEIQWDRSTITRINDVVILLPWVNGDL